MRDTTPMVLVNSRAAVDRIYAETGAFQWAREAALNSIEAGATRVHFGLDWNGVEATGTYRRFIADDGCGMTADELVTFFLELGGSSKQVGGAHENYGIGAKVSLLPWNTAGLVVVSWKDGEANAIWAWADPTNANFGLRNVEFEDETVEVWPATDDPDLGFDLEALKPPWVDQHGTVLLLLGDRLDQDTILNDPRHDQAGARQLDDYLNRRFWEIPNDVRIDVDQLSGKDRSRWPRSRTYRAEHGIQRRPVRGALRAIEPDGPQGVTRGVVPLLDGTEIRWFMTPPGTRQTGRAEDRGFIAALYKGELYEFTRQFADYRNFGVGHKDVRNGLWIIVVPRLADSDRRHGAFSEQDRNGLLWNEGGENTKLPWNEWAKCWTDRMPQPVRDAIAAQARGGTLKDDSYRERLARLFGDRWRFERLQDDPEGEDTVEPTEAARRRRRRKPVQEPAGEAAGGADPVTGADAGASPASPARPRVAIPDWEPATSPEDVGGGMIAAFMPRPRPGVVILNVFHSVIAGQVEHWTASYPHDPDKVREVVHDVYGECAVAAIAHSEQLTRDMPRRDIDKDVRSPASLTLALMGLWAQDTLIRERLAGSLGRQARAAEDVTA